MYCPNCGTETAEDAAFCAKCGTKIDPSAPNPSAPAARQKQPRTVIDSLPNAAEGVVKPVTLGALALLSFQIAAYAFGGANRMFLANLFDFAILPLDVILFGALADGLRRSGLRAAGPAACFSAALAVVVPTSILSMGLGLVMQPVLLKELADPNDIRYALEKPALPTMIAGLTAFVSCIVFIVRVSKTCDGRLRKFAANLIGLLILFVIVGGSPSAWSAFGKSKLAAIGCGATGCLKVVAHGYVLLSLSKLLVPVVAAGENASTSAKRPWKRWLVWAIVLLLGVAGIRSIPDKAPEVTVLNVMAGRTKPSDANIKKISTDLARKMFKDAGFRFNGLHLADFRPTGSNKWKATAVVRTERDGEQNVPMKIEYAGGMVKVKVDEEGE